jgi:TonB family protein
MTLSLFLLAAVADPAALAPSGKWVVDYAQTMCVLSRNYGSGDDMVTLGLRPLPMSENSEIVLITHDRAQTKLNGHAEIALLPAALPRTGTFSRFPLPKGPGRVATMYFDDDALAGLEQASAIDIRLDKESRRLATPGIAGAMKALSACQDNLLTHWGIDPAERKREATHVSGNPGRFFGASEYPLEAIRAHVQGRVVAIGKVATDGHVEACTVAETSGSKALDDTTCRIMRERVRFIPARDKDGNAVASHYIMPVRWVLPGS